MYKFKLITSFGLLLTVGGLFVSSCYADNNTDLSSKAEKNTIVIQNNSFQPSSLVITKGTTVTWINNDGYAHNIKADDFNSKDLQAGDSYKFKFDKEGTYSYSCGIHPFMKGKIIVK